MKVNFGSPLPLWRNSFTNAPTHTILIAKPPKDAEDDYEQRHRQRTVTRLHAERGQERALILSRSERYRATLMRGGLGLGRGPLAGSSLTPYARTADRSRPITGGCLYGEGQSMTLPVSDGETIWTGTRGLVHGLNGGFESIGTFRLTSGRGIRRGFRLLLDLLRSL